MARPVHRLKALDVERKKEPGYYADGGGLYLQVSPAITKSWIFRYTRRGRSREMGLGPYPAVTLAHGRQRASDARSLLAAGLDPLEDKRAKEAAASANEAQRVTFETDARQYVAVHAAGWKNAKHGDQWLNTLMAYAFPIIGDVPSSEVDTKHTLQVLEPIWITKTETATRVRQRIETVLDWSRTKGHRSGENPARWRGHLDKLLPKPGKVQKVRHHPALHYSKLPTFMKELAKQDGVAAQALTFLILTVARTSEVTGAQWPEIAIGSKLWTVPPERIKAEREHRVHLPEPAIQILQRMREISTGRHVFPGGRKGLPLSNGAFLALLKRMGRTDITAHGFRSTFKDWVSECTHYPSEVSEMALAHAVEDKVEAAYRRGDLLQKRRKLMNDWAKYALGR